MAGKHGNCCCHHDEQHDNHDDHHADSHAPQALAATESAGCCGGLAPRQDACRSNEHVQRSDVARSSS